MRVDAFNIYVEQLRDGNVEEIDESFPPAFLDVKEEGLSFVDSVKVTGEVYLAGEELVLHFALSAHGLIPCSICNEPVKMDIEIQDLYHAEPLAEIKTGIYNFREVVREAILLETPAFTECGGNCPKRQEIKKYLKDPQEKSVDEDRYHPFKDL
jgi:uncharacterized metal-binding protein YceD (DUF177 family)